MKFLEGLRLKTGPHEGRDSWIWAAKYAAVFIFFLLFFIPMQQRLSSYSSNQRSLKSQIQDLKKISEGFLNEQEIQRMRERSEFFMAGLIDMTKAAALIDKVSSEGDKNHLNIIQIYSDSPVQLKNDRGEELELEGKKLNLLPVSFRADATYKDVGNFLLSLYQNSKEVYMVESIHIQRASPETETLQCDITLSYIAV